MSDTGQHTPEELGRLLAQAHERIVELEAENKRLYQDSELAIQTREEHKAAYDLACARIAELEAQAAEFDEEWVCPECSSYDTEDLGYEDDLSSRRCRDCGYTGDPGEDFPTVRKVRQHIVELEAARNRLVKSMGGPDIATIDDCIEARRQEQAFASNLRERLRRERDEHEAAREKAEIRLRELQAAYRKDVCYAYREGHTDAAALGGRESPDYAVDWQISSSRAALEGLDTV